MSLGAFLTAAAGPLAKRVVQALGIGVVSFVGINAALQSLLDLARSAWSGLGAEMAAYLAMSGATTAMAIISGALIARVGLMQLKRFQAL